MKNDLFLKKMKGVKPLREKDNFIKSDKKKINETKKNFKKISDLEIKKNTNQVKTKSYNLSFGDINRDLKKGRVKIDRTVDLHGYGLLDAQIKFKNEVIKAYKDNKRCILFITGKGTHIKNSDKNYKDDKPRLFYGKIKNSILDWIKENDLTRYILTYQNAGIERGGDGAIYIYLRKKKLNLF